MGTALFHPTVTCSRNVVFALRLIGRRLQHCPIAIALQSKSGEAGSKTRPQGCVGSSPTSGTSFAVSGYAGRLSFVNRALQLFPTVHSVAELATQTPFAYNAQPKEKRLIDRGITGFPARIAQRVACEFWIQILVPQLVSSLCPALEGFHRRQQWQIKGKLAFALASSHSCHRTATSLLRSFGLALRASPRKVIRKVVAARRGSVPTVFGSFAATTSVQS